MIYGKNSIPKRQKVIPMRGARRAEKDIGLLLQCNVVVYEDMDLVFVSTVLPTVSMSVLDKPSLAGIARTVEGKLKKVVDSVVKKT